MGFSNSCINAFNCILMGELIGFFVKITLMQVSVFEVSLLLSFGWWSVGVVFGNLDSGGGSKKCSDGGKSHFSVVLVFIYNIVTAVA